MAESFEDSSLAVLHCINLIKKNRKIGMSLYDIWKENPAQITDKRVDQIIGFAGDGKLGDNNSAPDEFRSFLRRIPLEHLSRYAEECLNKAFSQSGLALQDIVNEMANRLGFEIQHGRYRGVKGEIGFDGIWTGPNGHAIVVEVKTTDAYRLPIETVANYRRALIRKEIITEENSSILVVVGREDTGEIEAQIRGSRNAWDVRLISIDALIRLMRIRQEVDDPSTESRIRSLLIPREYTRIDEIIDLVFSTTEELLEDDPIEEESNDKTDEPSGKKEKPVSFNDACAAKISKYLSTSLTKQSRTIFTDTDKDITVSCAVSKEYPEAKGSGYWFAFHPHQLEKLKKSKFGYAAFGCGSSKNIALLPVSFLEPQLEGMNSTQREEGRFYWHIQIHKKGNQWVLHRRAGEDWPGITDKILLEE